MSIGAHVRRLVLIHGVWSWSEESFGKGIFPDRVVTVNASLLGAAPPTSPIIIVCKLADVGVPAGRWVPTRMVCPVNEKMEESLSSRSVS